MSNPYSRDDLEWIVWVLERVTSYAEETGRKHVETGNLRAILNLDEKD